jgi:hypothetical protein
MLYVRVAVRCACVIVPCCRRLYRCFAFAGLVSAVLIIFTFYEKAAREIQQEGGFKELLPQMQG